MSPEPDRYQWVQDLLDNPTKTMGTYLALICLRFIRRYADFDKSPEPQKLILEFKDQYAQYFSGRGSEALDAVRAGEEFFSRLFREHGEHALKADPRNAILEEIEAEFYQKFCEAFLKYLSPKRIPPELRRTVQDFLSKVKVGFYAEDRSLMGSCLVWAYQIKKHPAFEDFKDKDLDEFKKLIAASGYAIVRDDLIFPAPALSDQAVQKLVEPAQPPSVEPEVVTPPPAPPEPERYLRLKPAKEVLESITASVLEDLGFEVRTNQKMEARSGEPIEVDVWAERRVGGIRFSVYGSCKNWDRRVGRPVIDEEHGRIDNLRYLPQLKIMVVKELTEGARDAAEADGFLVIELGEKAEAQNAVDAYNLIYRTLNELFTAIAPRRLRQMAAKVSEIAAELKKLERELVSLTSAE